MGRTWPGLGPSSLQPASSFFTSLFPM
jgi:hypothetical protein